MHNLYHSKYGAILEVNLFDNPIPATGKAKCIECDASTHDHLSSKCKRFSHLGQREGEHKFLDVDNTPVKTVIRYPVYKDGRICHRCFSKLHIGSVETAKGKRSVWLTPDDVEIIILFENRPNETMIPEKENIERGVWAEPTGSVMVLDGELVICPLPPDETVHAPSYLKFVAGNR